MRFRPVTTLAVFTAAALAASCASQTPAPAGSAAPSQTMASAEVPTFYEDVLPVLQESCQVCHTAQGLDLGGMVAPMAFTTYEGTRRYASRIAQAVESGYMPPWHAAEEHRGQFSNERLLEPEDAATLIAWARGGAPAGDPSDAPPPKRFTSSETGWSIGKPDLVIKLPEPYLVHDDVEDQYVNIPVEITAEMLPEDRWVKAVEFRAGSSAVHHIIADPLGGIAPGVEPTVHPDGYATVLRAGTTVTFNMHYHKEPGPGTAVWDQSSAAIIFYEPGEVIEHVVEGNPLGMFEFRIPPNEPNYSFKTQYTFEKDANIVWLTPHMHLRGKAALYEITRPGEATETLLHVPKYDFNWQHTYHFAEPVYAPAGSRVDLTLWWDNSADNPYNPDPSRVVGFGEPTTDEMGFGFMNFIEVEPRHYVVGDPIPAEIAGSRVVGDGAPND
jgi:mono/diheme cytochrome c family protein